MILSLPHKVEAFKCNILLSKTCFCGHTWAKSTRSKLTWLCCACRHPPLYSLSSERIALPPQPEHRVRNSKWWLIRCLLSSDTVSVYCLCGPDCRNKQTHKDLQLLFPRRYPRCCCVDGNMAACFLLLIYSILEELSLHGLLFRSDCSWLFRSCFRCSYLATLSVSSGAQSCAPGSCLPKWWRGRLAFSSSIPTQSSLLPCPPQDLLSRSGGRQMLARRDSPTPNQMLHFIVTSRVYRDDWWQEYKFGIGELSYILQTKPHWSFSGLPWQTLKKKMANLLNGSH